MEPRRKLVYRDAHIFWDTADFSLPEEVDMFSFKENCKSSLGVQGYVGEPCILAYDGTGDLSSSLKFTSAPHGVILRPRRSQYARHTCILVDMFDIASFLEPPQNLMLIMERIPEEDAEVVHVLNEMIIRNYNVFLVVEDEDHYLAYKPRLHFKVTVWVWADLVSGKCPLDVGDQIDSEEDDDGEEDDGEDDDDGAEEDGEEDDDEEEGISAHKRHKIH